ncbi:MAG: tyrosine--tRNA ligase [Chitinophagales bacterium]|nr:tyrosine--tRNA ligase [Chitinophagales bacterium]MCO5279819.1 tyrosine--tRNA ligase [Chitinophagales bacterium]OJV30514.1 MAG: tyrosine--tRNA ligase [Bacteroidetes bacterium 37-13]
MKNFIEELKWRNMLHDMIPGTEELLNKQSVKGYIGFDPTADSLGIGNMVQVMTLLHYQQCGHQPVALVGGATGMIGDPTGKSEERNLLSEDILIHNLECQKKQLEKFLDFSGSNAASIVNNYDWFKEISFLEFIRDAGKYVTVNYMLAKDSVQKRLENGMTFTEFSYQLVQGFDFYWLWKNKGIQLQMGGSDQWGNIVTGTELIRKKAGGEAFALTTKLLMKADGTKFGKSESGNVWLDAAKTSPYKFYQFFLNVADDDAPKVFRIFSLSEKEEIEAIEKEHQTAPHLRLIQKRMAEEIVMRVHGNEALEKAKEATEILFGKSTTEALQQLSERDILEVFEGVPTFEISKDTLSGSDWVSVLGEHTKVFASKGEARRSLQENAVSVNKEKVTLTDAVDVNRLLNGKYFVVQKGKKNYFLLKVTA